jgi:predicted nucleic acid-binding protein
MTASPVVVIDASVALAIVHEEPEGRAAESMISTLTRVGTRLLVPSHFWLEVTNSLLRRHQWSGDRALGAIHAVDELGFETKELDRGLIVLALDLGERHGLTAYDAAYLALAISMDGSIATLDADLRAAAGARALQVGPARLSETPAAYEHAVTWPNYKGASAFLSALRAEAVRTG